MGGAAPAIRFAAAAAHRGRALRSPCRALSGRTKGAPPPVTPGASFSDALLPDASDSLVQRASKALQRGAVGGRAQRLADSLGLPVLLQRYGKNLLTHGTDFLRGDNELPVFVAGARGLPTWYPIPDEEHSAYARSAVTKTDKGTVVMHGMHGGANAGLQLLGNSKSGGGGREQLGAGACGMGSSAQWNWDLSQHHWLEFTVKTDGRKYELVMQVRRPESYVKPHEVCSLVCGDASICEGLAICPAARSIPAPSSEVTLLLPSQSIPTGGWQSAGLPLVLASPIAEWSCPANSSGCRWSLQHFGGRSEREH